MLSKHQYLTIALVIRLLESFKFSVQYSFLTLVGGVLELTRVLGIKEASAAWMPRYLLIGTK